MLIGSKQDTLPSESHTEATTAFFYEAIDYTEANQIANSRVFY